MYSFVKEHLLYILILLNVSQTKFALYLDTTKQTVSNWCNQKCKFSSIDYLAVMAVIEHLWNVKDMDHLDPDTIDSKKAEKTYYFLKENLCSWRSDYFKEVKK